MILNAWNIKGIMFKSHSKKMSKSITSKAQSIKILEDPGIALSFIRGIDLDVILYTSLLPTPQSVIRKKTLDFYLLRRMDSDEFWTILNQLWK